MDVHVGIVDLPGHVPGQGPLHVAPSDDGEESGSVRIQATPHAAPIDLAFSSSVALHDDANKLETIDYLAAVATQSPLHSFVSGNNAAVLISGELESEKQQLFAAAVSTLARELFDLIDRAKSTFAEEGVTWTVRVSSFKVSCDDEERISDAFATAAGHAPEGGDDDTGGSNNDGSSTARSRRDGSNALSPRQQRRGRSVGSGVSEPLGFGTTSPRPFDSSSSSSSSFPHASGVVGGGSSPFAVGRRGNSLTSPSRSPSASNSHCQGGGGVLRVRDDPVFGPSIPGLWEVAVSGSEEVNELLASTQAHLFAAPTTGTSNNNSRRRYHCGFSFTLSQLRDPDTLVMNKGEGYSSSGLPLALHSRLNIVLIARASSSGGGGGGSSGGGGGIPKWVRCLSDVLASVERSSPGIPFSASRLTSLLKDSLSGKTVSSFVAVVPNAPAVGPALLQFAKRIGNASSLLFEKAQEVQAAANGVAARAAAEQAAAELLQQQQQQSQDAQNEEDSAARRVGAMLSPQAMSAISRFASASMSASQLNSAAFASPTASSAAKAQRGNASNAGGTSALEAIASRLTSLKKVSTSGASTAAAAAATSVVMMPSSPTAAGAADSSAAMQSLMSPSRVQAGADSSSSGNAAGFGRKSMVSATFAKNDGGGDPFSQAAHLGLRSGSLSPSTVARQASKSSRSPAASPLMSGRTAPPPPPPIVATLESLAADASDDAPTHRSAASNNNNGSNSEVAELKAMVAQQQRMLQQLMASNGSSASSSPRIGSVRFAASTASGAGNVSMSSPSSLASSSPRVTSARASTQHQQSSSAFFLGLHPKDIDRAAAEASGDKQGESSVGSGKLFAGTTFLAAVAEADADRSTNEAISAADKAMKMALRAANAAKRDGRNNDAEDDDDDDDEEEGHGRPSLATPLPPPSPPSRSVRTSSASVMQPIAAIPKLPPSVRPSVAASRRTSAAFSAAGIGAAAAAASNDAGEEAGEGKAGNNNSGLRRASSYSGLRRPSSSVLASSSGVNGGPAASSSSSSATAALVGQHVAREGRLSMNVIHKGGVSGGLTGFGRDPFGPQKGELTAAALAAINFTAAAVPTAGVITPHTVGSAALVSAVGASATLDAAAAEASSSASPERNSLSATGQGSPLSRPSFLRRPSSRVVGQAIASAAVAAAELEKQDEEQRAAMAPSPSRRSLSAPSSNAIGGKAMRGTVMGAVRQARAADAGADDEQKGDGNDEGDGNAGTSGSPSSPGARAKLAHQKATAAAAVTALSQEFAKERAKAAETIKELKDELEATRKALGTCKKSIQDYEQYRDVVESALSRLQGEITKLVIERDSAVKRSSNLQQALHREKSACSAARKQASDADKLLERIHAMMTGGGDEAEAAAGIAALSSHRTVDVDTGEGSGYQALPDGDQPGADGEGSSLLHQPPLHSTARLQHAPRSPSAASVASSVGRGKRASSASSGVAFGTATKPNAPSSYRLGVNPVPLPDPSLKGPSDRNHRTQRSLSKGLKESIVAEIEALKKRAALSNSVAQAAIVAHHQQQQQASSAAMATPSTARSGRAAPPSSAALTASAVKRGRAMASAASVQQYAPAAPPAPPVDVYAAFNQVAGITSPTGSSASSSASSSSSSLSPSRTGEGRQLLFSLLNGGAAAPGSTTQAPAVTSAAANSRPQSRAGSKNPSPVNKLKAAAAGSAESMLQHQERAQMVAAAALKAQVDLQAAASNRRLMASREPILSVSRRAALRQEREREREAPHHQADEAYDGVAETRQPQQQQRYYLKAASSASGPGHEEFPLAPPAGEDSADDYGQSHHHQQHHHQHQKVTMATFALKQDDPTARAVAAALLPASVNNSRSASRTRGGGASAGDDSDVVDNAGWSSFKGLLMSNGIEQLGSGNRAGGRPPVASNDHYGSEQSTGDDAGPDPAELLAAVQAAVMNRLQQQQQPSSASSAAPARPAPGSFAAAGSSKPPAGSSAARRASIINPHSVAPVPIPRPYTPRSSSQASSRSGSVAGGGVASGAKSSRAGSVGPGR